MPNWLIATRSTVRLRCPNIMRGDDDFEEPIDVHRRKELPDVALGHHCSIRGGAKPNGRSERNEVRYHIDAKLWDESLDQVWMASSRPRSSHRCRRERHREALRSLCPSLLVASGCSASRHRRVDKGRPEIHPSVRSGAIRDPTSRFLVGLTSRPALGAWKR
jgi:hypothetical protein